MMWWLWPLWLLLGGVVGWLTILMHVWTVAQLGPHSPSWFALPLVAGAYVRWGMVVGLFIAALHHDVVALLLAFVGLWLVRRVLLWRLNAGRAFGKLLNSGGC